MNNKNLTKLELELSKLLKKAIDALLKINSTVKRKKKASVDKQKDLFTGIIMALQAVQTRTILTQTELKLDWLCER
jgi:hypothetical protein